MVSLISLRSGVGNHYEKQGSTVVKYYHLAGQRARPEQGRRVAIRKDGVVYYLVGDHPSLALRTSLGTTSAVLDANGGLVAESRHYPYGGERWTSGTLPTDYRFTGQRSESGLGLVHMGARWYDPALGRWTSPDTIVPDPANPQSLNRFAYVYNNALVLVDPSGHAPSDGCDDEGCLSDPDSWGAEFIAYLLETIDSSDPSDNPLGQLILRHFYFIYPFGVEDGASINEIVTEAIAGA